MICDNIEERQALFERLGGLPEAIVSNSEWLYMLQEDTRQSLAIEGQFASEEDLEAVLKGGKTDLDIANYFRTAQSVYDLGLQYYRAGASVSLDVPVVRHIHSELFRGLDDRRGAFRTGPVHIHGAKITPPEFEITAYVQTALDITQDILKRLPVLQALARAYTLFESIHPFHDGNGRTGRILLNYLALSKGYPPIVIKGIAAEERSRYYHALEAADRGFQRGWPDATPQALGERLNEGDFEPLSQLLCEGLLPRLDLMTILAMEKQEALMEMPEVAAQLGIREDALRQRIQRGKHLAIKRGKKLYSHPRLAL
jgi:Fic family protein